MFELYRQVERNREQRKTELAPKDLLLLRSTSTGILYVSSLYENQWKIAATETVGVYLDKMEEIMFQTVSQTDRDYRGEHNYLSIIDVHMINEYTQDLVYYLVAEFDAARFQPRRHLFKKMIGYLNKVRNRDSEVVGSRTEPTIPAHVTPMRAVGK